jgi:hypothetical protein
MEAARQLVCGVFREVLRREGACVHRPPRAVRSGHRLALPRCHLTCLEPEHSDCSFRYYGAPLSITGSGPSEASGLPKLLSRRMAADGDDHVTGTRSDHDAPEASRRRPTADPDARVSCWGFRGWVEAGDAEGVEHYTRQVLQGASLGQLVEWMQASEEYRGLQVRSAGSGVALRLLQSLNCASILSCWCGPLSLCKSSSIGCPWVWLPR